ncbi:MAG: aminotransferase class I/II-fold pyridoxal phosphate-dependent enzyme [Oscillospiraceae bacterium]|nr:aminotransferase class I/II-fold pyridoxal phosphate-dependent enzyme [Oscillospiraceae bacterium]
MIKEEMSRLNRLSQSAQKFSDLYEIITTPTPDRPAAMWLDADGNERSRSFKEFAGDVRAAAALFRRRIGESGEGSFVALAMGNGYYWPVAFWGLLMAGYKPVLLDASGSAQLLGGLIYDSGATAAVGTAEFPAGMKVVTPDEIAKAMPSEGFKARFANEMALCTSGTTSTSKVYVFGERAIVGQIVGVIAKVKQCPRLVEDDKDPVRHLAFLPLHHVFGFIVHCMMFPCVGKTVVYLADRSPATIQETCKRFRVTNLVVVPLLLNNLASGIWRNAKLEGKEVPLKKLFAVSSFIQRVFPKSGPDIASRFTKSIQNRLLGDSIRTVIVGGSHVPADTLKTVGALGYYTLPGFGMTECGITSFESRPQPRFRASGCTGAPLGGVEYKTVDADGRPVAVGELCIRGASMHRARFTAGRRLPSDCDGDGWFRTGDIARLDNGNLYIEGRLKEVIINESGENVYPDELEDEFRGVMDVEHLCILALGGIAPYQDIALVFRLKDGGAEAQKIAAAAVQISQINAALPIHKRVRKLYFTSQPLPLANGIKVRRQKLGEMIKDKEIVVRLIEMGTGAMSVPQSGTEETPPELFELRGQVARCVAEVLKLPPEEIGFDKHFLNDLGGDSLDSLNLLVKAETVFALTLDDAAYRKCATVNDLARLIWRTRTGAADTAVKEPEAQVTQIASFTDSREYLAFRQRLEGMAGVSDPYFIRHDSVLRDVSTVGGRDVLNFASYNYLCMSGHPETVLAAREAAERYGTSASGSRLLAGEKTMFRELESEISAWKHTQGALVLVGGHSTNVTFVGSFCNEHDLILYDALSHNSIIQGCELSRATCRAFPHNDVSVLKGILQMCRARFEKVLLVVEGVYSMDGDIAPIDEFVKLKKEFGLFLMVDEAHSSCVLGETGGGVDEHFGLAPDDIDIKMGTLSKGLGSCGGYLAGKQELIEYLRYNMPGFVFSVGISPPVAAAALAALRVIKKDTSHVASLRKNIARFVTAARNAGLDTCLGGETAIIPVLIGSDENAFRLSELLLKRGVCVPPAVYPAVPAGSARLRFCVTSGHKDEQIDFAVAQLLEAAREAGIILPKKSAAS